MNQSSNSSDTTVLPPVEPQLAEHVPAQRALQAESGLLAQVLSAASFKSSNTRAWSRLDKFLAEPTALGALCVWLDLEQNTNIKLDIEHLKARLCVDIARLDALLNEQVNAILHHPRFQRLEASWRGLQFLTDNAYGAEGVKLRVLNATWTEVTQDLERAIDFDQSQLFHKIYSDEFGSPGGAPFGAMLCDYPVRHRPSAEHPYDDLPALQALSHIGAAAFAPIVLDADPALFGVDEFADLGGPLNLERSFQQMEYLKWRAFRDTEDARFIGLALPKALMRLPYNDDGARADNFRFKEKVEGADSSSYLWGSAVYAFGAVLTRAFSQSGWLAQIQGIGSDGDSGGLVKGLPVHSFGTDATGVAHKYSTDVLITENLEKALDELGFIALCHCKDTDWSAFYGSASVQKAKRYDRVPATSNAKLSARLQYMFCVSRFAHYLKVIARDKVGVLSTARECETYLQKWIHNYTIATDDAGDDAKSKAPLREARIEVNEIPGKPGSYACVAHLRPHFQLDQVVTALRLVTELAPSGQ